MNITKTDVKVILLWTIIAFIIATIGGKVLLETDLVKDNSSRALWLFWLFIYGFGGFMAGKELKEKTELSWRIAALFMVMILIGIPIIIFILYYVTLFTGLSLHINILEYSGLLYNFGIIFIYAAIFLGGYISHKVSFQKRKA